MQINHSHWLAKQQRSEQVHTRLFLLQQVDVRDTYDAVWCLEPRKCFKTQQAMEQAARSTANLKSAQPRLWQQPANAMRQHDSAFQANYSTDGQMG
jgi:hypothetical protein